MKFKILEDFTYGEGADALELTEGMVVDAPATTGKAGPTPSRPRNTTPPPRRQRPKRTPRPRPSSMPS